MEQAQKRDAHDERDAPSIDPMESFDTLYRKVRHCPSCASLFYVQCELPGLPTNDGPQLKRCRRCWAVKLASEFTRDSSRPDGLSRNCRKCDAERSKQRRLRDGDLLRVRERQRYSADPDRQRKAAAEYRRSDRGKRLNARAVQRYRARNAEKHAAHVEVRKAIAAGILTKPDRCELAHLGGCSGRLEAHHHDYTRPLEVRWLCVSHHQSRHYKPRTCPIPAPLFERPQALGEYAPPILEAAE